MPIDIGAARLSPPSPLTALSLQTVTSGGFCAAALQAAAVGEEREPSLISVWETTQVRREDSIQLHFPP